MLGSLKKIFQTVIKQIRGSQALSEFDVLIFQNCKVWEGCNSPAQVLYRFKALCERFQPPPTHCRKKQKVSLSTKDISNLLEEILPAPTTNPWFSKRFCLIPISCDDWSELLNMAYQLELGGVLNMETTWRKLLDSTNVNINLFNLFINFELISFLVNFSGNYRKNYY